MTEWPRVLIAGGSIGGLTAAVLLRDLGCDVHVYERSSAALQERGTGIVVLPITERYFAGDRSESGRVSLLLPYWTYVDREGRELSSDLDNFRFSGWNTLYRALLERFDDDRYHLDSEMVGFEQGDTTVVLQLADGRTAEGDLLVCADGLRSTARSIVLPDVDPAYCGYVAWRGTTPESELSDVARDLFDDAMVYQVLDHSHILVYAIPGLDGSVSRGERLLNFVWYRNYPVGGPFEELMTGNDGHRHTATMPPGTIREEFVAEMRRTAEDTLAPQIAEVVLGAREPLIQAIFDLESPRMAFGRVCIMGDAAFGVRPHVAAGQAKACADAWALRDAMQEAGGDVLAALAAWEPRQLDVGRSVVARSREMGIRSQVEGTMVPGDPTWKFGLHGPGD